MVTEYLDKTIFAVKIYFKFILGIYIKINQDI